MHAGGMRSGNPKERSLKQLSRIAASAVVDLARGGAGIGAIHLRRWPARGAGGAGVRRRLVGGPLGGLCAAPAVAGTAGIVRYVGTFWLSRGFAPPSTAPSVAVSGPSG